MKKLFSLAIILLAIFTLGCKRNPNDSKKKSGTIVCHASVDDPAHFKLEVAYTITTNAGLQKYTYTSESPFVHELKGHNMLVLSIDATVVSKDVSYKDSADKENIQLSVTEGEKTLKQSENKGYTYVVCSWYK